MENIANSHINKVYHRGAVRLLQALGKGMPCLSNFVYFLIMYEVPTFQPCDRLLPELVCHLPYTHDSRSISPCIMILVLLDWGFT